MFLPLDKKVKKFVDVVVLLLIIFFIFFHLLSSLFTIIIHKIQINKHETNKIHNFTSCVFIA